MIFFTFEVFPKIGTSLVVLKGESFKAEFLNIKFLIECDEVPIGITLPNGTNGSASIPNYHRLLLTVQKKRQEASQYLNRELVCDLLSMGTGHYMKHVSPLLDNYSNGGGWSTTQVFPKGLVSKPMQELYLEDTFLDYKILRRLIRSIKKSPYKERIRASFHFNRLAKYKAFSHVTEAVVDCVSALEALYMTENGDYQSEVDSNIFNGHKPKKTPALIQFLRKYYLGNQADIDEIEKLKIYKIRSAYLHRGIMQDPKNGILSIISLDKLDEQLRFNIFFKVAYETILNFSLKS